MPKARQSGEHSFEGRETKGDAWLKWILIESAWAHIRYCPEGHLAMVFKDACKLKGISQDAIKIVARKLMNVVWAVLTYEKEFMVK